MNRIIQIELSKDSFFTNNYLRNLLGQPTQRDYPIIAERSDGVRFIVLSSFHDAKIIDVSIDETFWRKCITISIDFSQTSTGFKSRYKKFGIKFLGVKNIKIPIKTRDVFILSFDCLQESSILRAYFELEYYIGGETHNEIWEIEFSDVEVKPLCKR